MVMRKNRMRKNLQRSILRSLGRYIAIVAIIALGTSMFVGLQQTKVDMVATGQSFTDEQNMFDLRLISTLGWDREQVADVEQMDGVVDAEGTFYTDFIVYFDEEDDEESVYRFYTLPEDVNQVALRGGRMPERPDECLADGFHADDSILGRQVTLADSNEEESLDVVNYRTFTIVGYVATPLYIDMNRGSTSVGNGSLSSYFYVPETAFDVDYYTEIYVTIPGDYSLYTDAYNRAMESAAEDLEPLLIPLGEERCERVLEEAEKAYQEGLLEYEDGLREFEEGKLEAEQALEEGYQALLDAEEQLDSAEAQILSGEQQIADGKATLEESKASLESLQNMYDTAVSTLYAPLDASQAELEAQRASVTATLDPLHAELADIDARIAAVNAEMGEAGVELDQLNSQVPQLELSVAALEGSIWLTQAALDTAKLFPNVNADTIAQLEATLAELNAQYTEQSAQLATAKARQAELQSLLADPSSRLSELNAQRALVQAEAYVLEQSLSAIQAGLDAVAASRAAADEQLASIGGQLADARQQIIDGEQQIMASQAQLAQARNQLAKGREELAQGWIDYEKGKLEAEQKIADGERELAEAAVKLADAREELDSIHPDVYVLDRNSNVGYASLETNSDIVYSISKILPIFFVLIACLVCITTMTRMIDEERTQIGTLKALGYGSFAIMSKYLIYAGSAALIGSILGVAVGSTIFPMILWQAYCIMMYVQPNVVLTLNWPLNIGVTLLYTAAMLFASWYCCYRTLREVPAELIRPKPPAVGRKILLERLPFWNRISFLNKVTIRNIFRYKQRLAMMLVGIGGCTALLLTGFGLRDTITGIADFQFGEVTVYDLQVYFSGDQSEDDQANFREDMEGDAEDLLFFHQQSMDIEANDTTREIYLMATSADVADFVNFHSGDTPLRVPGKGEMLLTVGVAEAMGVEVGDEVTLRNVDMQTLTLTVSGIYDNYVYNYAVVTPDTIHDQWGAYPGEQMAMVKVGENRDVHEVSAKIANMPGVMNVSVSVDTADMVGGMMDALDLVVWVIVICAGALAAIVLYNLTNININERIREIATIKVLGFTASETGAYVFKENLALTVVGVIVGMPLGWWFLGFVIERIKINMVWFQPKASILSYVLAAVITIISALIVDWIFYHKLEKINMAEALKSVE